MKNSTLHIIRLSPFENNNCQLCLEHLTPNDGVILMDDGCYSLKHSLLNELIKKTSNVYSIEKHSKARGLVAVNGIATITLTQFNELLFEYKNSVTWQ